MREHDDFQEGYNRGFWAAFALMLCLIGLAALVLTLLASLFRVHP